MSKTLKSNLKQLMIDMKKYMDDNKLRDDLFMKMLTDDIFIAHTTFGTAHGHMYVASRQTSQATQGIHNNTVHVPDYNEYSLPKMTRGVTYQIQQMEEDELPPIPVLRRGVTCQIQQMEEDEEDFEIEVMCGDLSNHLYTMNEDEDEDCAQNNRLSIPSLKRTNGKSVGFCQDDEDDVFSRHITLDSDISPYANIKTVSLMREVSYTSKKTDSDEP